MEDTERKKLAKRAIKSSFSLVAFLGFMLIYGSVGGGELGQLPLHQVISRSLVGLAMLGGGLLFSGSWTAGNYKK